MIDSTFERELHQQLETLPEPKQRQVLEYAKSLAKPRPKGVSGAQFLEMTGTIPPDDIALMAQAIKEEFDHVDLSQW